MITTWKYRDGWYSVGIEGQRRYYLPTERFLKETKEMLLKEDPKDEGIIREAGYTLRKELSWGRNG